MATQSRLLNTGQSCIAAKRFIVLKEVADKFTQLFVEDTEAEVRRGSNGLENNYWPSSQGKSETSTSRTN